MTTINLLPWREKSRVQQQRQLIIFAVIALCIILFIDGAWTLFLQSKISAQNTRNNMLQKEIQQANSYIKKKSKLEAEKNELMGQMSTLKEVNNQRFRLVELADVLPKILPNGTYVSSINVQKNIIELRGQAPTDIQASELVKRLRQQPGWKNVQLLEIQSDKAVLFRITLDME